MTANQALLNYLSSLTPAMRKIKVQDICDVCGVTPTVLFNWYRSRTPLKRAYLPAIEQAIGESIFEGVEV